MDTCKQWVAGLLAASSIGAAAQTPDPSFTRYAPNTEAAANYPDPVQKIFANAAADKPVAPADMQEVIRLARTKPSGVKEASPAVLLDNKQRFALVINAAEGNCTLLSLQLQEDGKLVVAAPVAAFQEKATKSESELNWNAAYAFTQSQRSAVKRIVDEGQKDPKAINPTGTIATR